MTQKITYTKKSYLFTIKMIYFIDDLESLVDKGFYEETVLAIE
ncbi:hypothetical protein MHK_008160 [Candidatus Magnetomorum sp. HK-1]|nr:hypothetical protein MHK_008160 [Candidatus Magnetomorum sp. HK-1]